VSRTDVSGSHPERAQQGRAVARNERRNPIVSRLRSLLLVVVLGIGVVATTGLSGLTTGAGAFGATIPGELRVIGILLATLVNLKGTRESYDVFALVLGLIAWIYLRALVTVLATEVNVVAQRHLWPASAPDALHRRRAADSGPRAAYTAYAESERHKGFERIDDDLAPPDDATAYDPEEDRQEGAAG
jgi:membrane protein